MFTNESNWSESKDEWKEYKKNIEVYFHRTLEEFENDIHEVMNKYDIKLMENPATGFKIWRTTKVKEEILAFIVDEAVYIYREGYLVRENDRLARMGIDMLPKHYGKPRRDFMNQIKFLAGLPSHFFLLSKVGKEYEDVYKLSADGKKKLLTFEATGEDSYRLPDDQEYEAGCRGHLFATEERAEEQDEAGDNVVTKTWWVRLVKNKADRDIEPLIKLPTIRKIRIRLNQLRIVRDKKAK